MQPKPTNCPCGSKQAYSLCCGRFLDGGAAPATALELMRSRYTAHCRANVAWLRKTLAPTERAGFDPVATAHHATQNRWTGLKILKTRRGGPDHDDGTVLFEASYFSANGPGLHRENSLFRKIDGQWYYVQAI